jgi:hypothetical protein
MPLFGLFRRPEPIRDLHALAEFIDAQSAFLVQKGIYEYARARAGVYAKILFTEKVFQERVEVARWQAFPLGLAMVGETVEGVLRPLEGQDRRTVLDSFIEIVLSVFDRYPPPTVLDPRDWSQAREKLRHDLDLIGVHARKAVKDVPTLYAEAYFALMPIHERLRGRDFVSVSNHLKATLINIHDEFVRRADAGALVDGLRRQA